MPEMICPQCKKPFRQGKKCKDDFHNAEKMVAYYQRKLEEVEEAEERRDALNEILERMKSKPNAEAEERNGDAGNHKPLSEVLEALKPEALPKPEQFKRRAW